jgi:hypothetical protein
LPVSATDDPWFASATLDEEAAFDASEIADVLLALAFEEGV